MKGKENDIKAEKKNDGRNKAKKVSAQKKAQIGSPHQFERIFFNSRDKKGDKLLQRK